MIDWDDLRYFLAIARHGNLSAAGTELRVAQSTVGRRLASLEAGLGVRLLDRTPNGYVSTSAGKEVLVKAERLEAEMLSFQREVGGRDAEVSGLVRVTCAESVASHILAPSLAVLHRKHPDLMIELIPNARELSLAMREADISVRLKQPNQHDLVTHRVGTLGFGLYASADYLDRHHDLDFEGGCPDHHLVAQLDDIEDAEQTGWLTSLGHRARVSIQTSSHEAAVKATANGAGLGCLACFRADREQGIVQLSPPISVPVSGIWVIVHKDNRSNARIRMVMTHVTEQIRARAGELTPRARLAPVTDP